MQQYVVKIYQSHFKTLWDTFFAKSNPDTFLFYRDFMDYHSDRFSDFSLLIYKNDKLIGLLPANKKEDKLYSHQGLTYGGIIYAPGLKTVDIINSFKTLLQFLETQEIKRLVIKELPSIYLNNSTNNVLQYLLFKTKANILRTDIHSVINRHFKSFSNIRKRGIKRGEKHQLKVKESQDFEPFWNQILVPNLESKHRVTPVHSLKEITLLKSRFKKNIRQFNVYHNTKIVGGTTIFEMQHIAHCQYISGNADKNMLGGLDFLYKYLIDEVFANKLYFSFGTSNINSGQQINEGLQFWKEGFGARSVPQGFYEIATENYKLLEDVFI